MRKFVLIVLCLNLGILNAQINFECISDEFPIKLELSAEEQKEFKVFIDSLRLSQGMQPTKYKTTLDSIQNETLFSHYDRLRELKLDSIIDSISIYKILFVKKHEEIIPPPAQIGKTVSESLEIYNKEINLENFLNVEKDNYLPSSYNSIKIKSYGQKYLIIKFCDEYIGNTSWASTKTVFLEKLSKKE